MKKIEILGRKLSIGIEKIENDKSRNKKKEKNKKDTEVSKKEIVNEKLTYLILIFMLTVLSANSYIFHSKLKLPKI